MSNATLDRSDSRYLISGYALRINADIAYSFIPSSFSAPIYPTSTHLNKYAQKIAYMHRNGCNALISPKLLLHLQLQMYGNNQCYLITNTINQFL